MSTTTYVLNKKNIIPLRIKKQQQKTPYLELLKSYNSEHFLLYFFRQNIFFLCICFTKYLRAMANSVDPDQTAPSGSGSHICISHFIRKVGVHKLRPITIYRSVPLRAGRDAQIQTVI